jgi:hypothetical protein
MFRRSCLALIPLLFTVSCLGTGEVTIVLDGAGDHQTTGAPIINGEAPDAPEHDAVVSLHQLSGNSVYVLPFCSGTLVTGDVVVTAAHCLDTARGNGPNFKTLDPSALAIYVGNDPTVDILDHLYLVDETLINSGYNRQQQLNDIAAVRLGVPITEGYAPVPHLPAGGGLGLEDPADIGELLNFAGFGDDENGVYGVKLQIDGLLGGFGCSVPGCGGGSSPATQISYSQPTGGPCYGDSGGPAFIYRAAVPYLAGITSYGDASCSLYGVSTRIDAFEGWIDNFIAVPDCSADGVCNAQCAAGDDPDCGPDCSADGVCNAQCPLGGDPDCGLSSCGDGICGAGESCDGRNGTSACSDCDGKTNGRPSGRFCYVEGVCEGPGCP